MLLSLWSISGATASATTGCTWLALVPLSSVSDSANALDMIGGTDGAQRHRRLAHAGIRPEEGARLYNDIFCSLKLLFHQLQSAWLRLARMPRAPEPSPVLKEMFTRMIKTNGLTYRTQAPVVRHSRPPTADAQDFRRCGASKSEHHSRCLVGACLIQAGRQWLNIVGRLAGLLAPNDATKTIGLAPYWARLSRCSGDGVKHLISVFASPSESPRQL